MADYSEGSRRIAEIVAPNCPGKDGLQSKATKPRGSSPRSQLQHGLEYEHGSIGFVLQPGQLDGGEPSRPLLSALPPVVALGPVDGQASFWWLRRGYFRSERFEKAAC